MYALIYKFNICKFNKIEGLSLGADASRAPLHLKPGLATHGSAHALSPFCLHVAPMIRGVMLNSLQLSAAINYSFLWIGAIRVTMTTNVFGSVLHPLQVCGWILKDSKCSAPGDRNNKHEVHISVGRLVLFVQFPSASGCRGYFEC